MRTRGYEKEKHILDNSTTLLRLVREVISQSKLLPPKLEKQTCRYTESQFIQQTDTSREGKPDP